MNVEEFSTYIKEHIDPGVVVTPFARGTRDKVFGPGDRALPGHALAHAVSYVNKSNEDVTAIMVGDQHRVVMVDGKFPFIPYEEEVGTS